MARYVTIDRLMTDLETLAGLGLRAEDVRESLGSTLVEPRALETYAHHGEERRTRILPAPG